ncbi:MAG: magnesium transporter [Planctomycetes bacterium]|nr:magnesium transporter [Planctomycetota bacterium]
MRSSLLAPELRELLHEGRREDLRTLLGELHPNDAATILAGLEIPEIVEALSVLPILQERDVFCYFEPELQQEIVRRPGRAHVRALLKAMPSDERYEFLDRLDPRVRAGLEPLLEQAARNDLLRRERYEDDQVGSFLSTEFCRLRAGMTVAEAMTELRRQEPSRETIYYSYVVDEAGKLIGFVSLRHLIAAEPTELVRDLMKTELVSIRASADQEDAVRLIREYDLIALPVVDREGVLVGIVTYDDAADIQEEESTEDIERMAGISGEAEGEGGYLAEPVLSQIRRRMPLIAFLAITYVFTSSVIASHEQALPHRVLIALLPMVMATGGMVGSQASSLVIRGLTVGDLEPGSFAAVIWKETRVSAGLAVILGSIVFGEGLLLAWLDDDPLGEHLRFFLIACSGMAVALAAHVLSAALIGVSIPILARATGRDPALVTPAVTAIADFFGASLFLLVVAGFLALV